MSLGKIGFIVAIPTIIIVLINWYGGGEIINALLEAFNIHPIFIAIVGLLGIITLIKLILEII